MFASMLELIWSAFEYIQLMPLHLHVNQKSDYDDDDDIIN